MANLRHRRFNNVESASSNDKGSITTSMNAIAGAVAQDLDGVKGVDHVERLVAYDRARPTLQYTVTANPDTPVERLTGAVENNERDFRAAFPDADLVDVSRMGDVTTKGVSLDGWDGNPAPRIAEAPSGRARPRQW